jgi:hypothetical protein
MLNKINENKVIKLYGEGMSQAKIAKSINRSQGAIWKILKKNNINCRGKKFRKHKINELFFETWTSNMAYILGFITADGNVSKNSLRIKIHKNDIEILEFIKSNLGGGPIRISKENYIIADFNSIKLIESLKLYEVVPNKTAKLKLNFDIPEIYIRDYIRGLFDGDGCVWLRPHGISCEIVSASKNFMDKIFAFIKVGKLRCRKYPNDLARNPQYILTINKLKNILEFRDFIYHEDAFALKRKKEKFYTTQLRKL